MLKVLKATNGRGDTYTFGKTIRFVEGPDFSGLSINEERDFNFRILVKRGNMNDAAMQAQKTRLYTVFNPNFNPFRLELLADDGKEYYIDANINCAPIMPNNRENDNAVGVKALLEFTAGVGSLLYEKNAVRTEMALWEEQLEFDVSEIVDNEFEFDIRAESQFKNIPNTGHEMAGIKITFQAMQEVANPSLMNVETYEKIKLETVMQAGDTIEVVNTRKRITIMRTRNNITTSIFGALSLDSDLLMLHPGDNILRYDADSGVDFLDVAIEHHNHWIGV